MGVVTAVLPPFNRYFLDCDVSLKITSEELASSLFDKVGTFQEGEFFFESGSFPEFGNDLMGEQSAQDNHSFISGRGFGFWRSFGRDDAEGRDSRDQHQDNECGDGT